jgi:hypothetical protein
MKFSNAMKSGNTNKFSLTENGARAYSTSGSYLLDLFSQISALRGKSVSDRVVMFKRAYDESPLYATKLAFYARNIRGGLGERDSFRTMLKTLAIINPTAVVKNLDAVVEFGRYDDLYELVGTACEESMWTFIASTISKDMGNVKAGKPVSLCAKWLKSVNTSSEESRKLGKLTAKALGYSEKNYRKMLSLLRGKIDVTEKKMSSNKWTSISYSQVPSYAMKKNRKAFSKHDPDGMAAFISAIQKGETKVNAATLFPYDIMMGLNLRENSNYEYGRNRNPITFTVDRDAVLEAQWKALPSYVTGEHNMLVMADTSGSMRGMPMATSIGLAVYFAQRNKGAYHNLFMTFSSEPSLVELKGETLQEQVACIPAIVSNTDLEAGFDLILDLAIANNVSQAEMPSGLIVISDGQYDEQAGRDGLSFYDSMRVKFSTAGYTIPTLVFWNCGAEKSSVHAQTGTAGVMLVSGSSPSIFKSVLNFAGSSPYESMIKVLDDEMYSKIVI